MVTADTNIAIYALTRGEKSELAERALAAVDFLSVQVLNEYANVGRYKFRRTWPEVVQDIALLRESINIILPIEAHHNADALRIAERYQLSFYDAVMLAVALSGGARIFYSEDMKPNFVIDGTLRIVDPFQPGALDT